MDCLQKLVGVSDCYYCFIALVLHLQVLLAGAQRHRLLHVTRRNETGYQFQYIQCNVLPQKAAHSIIKRK